MQKRNEFQKQRQMKIETKEKKVVLKKNVYSNQTPLWKDIRKYQSLDYFNISVTRPSTLVLRFSNYD